jgi:ubiquinone biosynthesis UbiH/UbiF/VisC/COQ6 family hydroxylase
MNYDVAIIGAGLSGLSLGLALSQAGRRVAVLDARPAQTFDPLPEGSFDARIYAISPASTRWLEGPRLWSALDATRTAPVYDMQIHGDAAVTLVPGLTLSAYRSGVGELCTIIEERELARVMASAARFATGLELLRPVQVVAMSGDEDAARLSLADGRVITAQLVIGADGAHSWARERAGIAVDTFDYHQTAVVANFACGKPHHNIASQWFRVEADGASGILAWLPLPGNRISMVWSVSTAFAQELMALEGQVLAERVALAGLNKLGAFACVGKPAAFPLRNQRARRLIGSRFALVADAAHVLHPLAGQGLNLGFGDCAALCAALAGARDCGDPLVLRSYERARKAALAEMHAVTHGIARLFSLDHPAARGLRNFGLNLVGRLPVIPRMIVRGAIRG